MADNNKVKVLIPSGYGLNCEEETAFGYRMAGADADIVHINDIIEKPGTMDDYHILALVGGFSDGDHIASGKVHANRLKYRLGEPLQKFIDEGKLIIGVCNGFQAMIKSGILPAVGKDYARQTVTLTYNDSGKFEDRWVHLKSNPKSNCIWTAGIDRLYLPVRHGEGKVRIQDENVLNSITSSGQIALYYSIPESGEIAMEKDYPHNPNGSALGIAGLADPTGRIFGMMPHWEGFMSPYNHPAWTRLKREGTLPREGPGLAIARNGVRYAAERLV